MSAVTCPFEDVVDQLYFPICSPSVCETSSSRRDTSKKKSFRWSIDQLSILKPAVIDEASFQDYPELDAESEEKAQQAIDSFFSQNSVVPSPWAPAVQGSRLTAPSSPVISSSSSSTSLSSPPSVRYSPGLREASTQTCFSFPPNVDLSLFLGAAKEQFLVKEEEEESQLQELETSSSSLRRKLFGDNNTYDHTPPVSPSGSPSHPPRRESGHLRTPQFNQFSPSPIAQRLRVEDTPSRHMVRRWRSAMTSVEEEEFSFQQQPWQPKTCSTPTSSPYTS